MNDKRLIEVAFPLKQASIDSVHEKNVRHGHISTLHLWPARRPLAASRAALIATLLPDPDDKEKRDDILKRMGGTLAKTLKKKKMPNGRIEEIEALETEGGVDVGPMGPLGVPFFGLAQDGTRYFDLHHTANDTLDKIDPAQLSQNVAAWAGLIWLIADSDVDFRAMKPAAAPAAPSAH